MKRDRLIESLGGDAVSEIVSALCVSMCLDICRVLILVSTVWSMNFNTKNSRLMLLILKVAKYIVGKMAAFK
jgi:hypothetical protein